MKTGERLRLTITDDTAAGKGIARMEEMVCFVDGGVTGDVCMGEVTEIRKNCAICRMTELLTPSVYRVQPDCPVYDRCGGCTLRHVTAEHALDCKRREVAQALRRVGLTTVPVAPIIATPEHGCRNKVLFHFSPRTALGERSLGYFAGESHTVLAESMDCALLPERFREIAAFVCAYGKSNPAFCSEDLHALYLRQNAHGKTLLTVTTGDEMACPAAFFAFADAVDNAFPDAITGVLHADDPAGKANGRRDVRKYARPRYTLLRGNGYLTDDFLGLRLRISPDGFFQVNHAGAAVLADAVLSRARAVLAGKPHADVVDLYCGSGFFALSVAKAFPDAHVTGIELNEDAVRDAMQNAVQTGVPAVRFLRANAADAFARYEKTPDLVIVDPPRAGLGDAMCQAILHSGAAHVLYVSCNPNTLARDLRTLHDHGYEIGEAQPVDMFPRSGHVETVVLLSRETNPLTVEVRMEVETGEVKEHPTYKRIQEYVQEKYGFKVHTAYIAEVKRMVGLDMHKAPNAVEQRKHEYHPCPPEKVEAIKDALRHFGLISE